MVDRGDRAISSGIAGAVTRCSGLVTFRIYWGFFGSSTARFRQFVRGPRVIAELPARRMAAGPGPQSARRAQRARVDQLLLLLQVALGLFAVDVDGIESGPLSLYVSFETGRAAAEWHEWVFNLLMSLIVLHIVAIAWYRFVKKEKLVAAMFHGTRAYPVATAAGAGRVDATFHNRGGAGRGAHLGRHTGLRVLIL